MKLLDIARMAGVSKTAVSLAINNKAGISEKTRHRILAIIEEQGFFPRALIREEARKDYKQSIRFLAFTRDDVISLQYKNTPFFLELIHGVEKECRANDYRLIFTSVGSDHSNDMPYGNEPIILLGTNMSAREIMEITKKQPKLVVLDGLFESINVDAVVINNSLGSYEAFNYLVSLGHRNIGYIRSRTRIDNFEHRLHGFLMAAKENDITFKEQNVFTVSATIDGAKEELKPLVSRATRDKLPTAFFCENDYLAIGAIKAFQELQINVPEEVSVIGFDDIPQAHVISPELTTINVEKAEMGAIAVRRLLEIMQKHIEIQRKIIISVHLVKRKSCKEIA